MEYFFNMFKAELNCNRTNVHSTKAWEGRLFLQVLATAIGGMMHAKIKLYNESAKLQNIYMTQVIADEPADIEPDELRDLNEIVALSCGDDLDDL